MTAGPEDERHGADRDGAGAALIRGRDRAIRAMLVGTTHLVVLVDPDGTIAYISPSATYHLGYRSEELVGRNFTELLHPDDLGEAVLVLKSDARRPDEGFPFTLEKDIPGDFRIRDSRGEWVPFEMLRNAMLAAPDIAGTLVVGRQVRHRRAFEEALSALAYDLDGVDAVRYLLGYLTVRLPGTCSSVLVSGAPSEWIGETEQVGPLLSGRGPWEAAMAAGQMVVAQVDRPGDMDQALAGQARDSGFAGCWNLPLPLPPSIGASRAPRSQYHRHQHHRQRSKTGSAEAKAGPSENGRLGCLVVWSSSEPDPAPGHMNVLSSTAGLIEIALRRRTERHRLRRLADYDHVTGALSRVGMKSVVAKGDPIPRAHLLVDLDDFKAVNDGYGHSVGDEVLRLAVKRVMSVLRHQDLIVRLGGDEFLILLAGADVAAAIAAAERVFSVLQQPVSLGSKVVSIGTSIGVAPYDPSATFEELTERADRAMYLAKNGGKNRWAVWSPGM